MHTLTQRQVISRIAQDISEAAYDSYDVLQWLLSAYRLANDTFSRKENDPDPATIFLGVQAQALGVRTLCDWLYAVATEVGLKYKTQADDLMARMDKAMMEHGLV